MSMKMLVVEDYGCVREVLGRIFSEFGFEVDEAGDCITAREKLLESPYEWVSLDHNLPDGTGFDLVRLAQSKGSRVIMITGDAEDRCVRCKAELLGVEHVFAKPIDSAQLLRHMFGSLQ